MQPVARCATPSRSVLPARPLRPQVPVACGAIVKKFLNTVEDARKSSKLILRKDVCNGPFPGGIDGELDPWSRTYGENRSVRCFHLCHRADSLVPSLDVLEFGVT
jgi:hypothetical protein